MKFHGKCNFFFNAENLEYGKYSKEHKNKPKANKTKPLMRRKSESNLLQLPVLQFMNALYVSLNITEFEV